MKPIYEELGAAIEVSEMRVSPRRTQASCITNNDSRCAGYLVGSRIGPSHRAIGPRDRGNYTTKRLLASQAHYIENMLGLRHMFLVLVEKLRFLTSSCPAFRTRRASEAGNEAKLLPPSRKVHCDPRSTGVRGLSFRWRNYLKFALAIGPEVRVLSITGLFESSLRCLQQAADHGFNFVSYLQNCRHCWSTRASAAALSWRASATWRCRLEPRTHELSQRYLPGRCIAVAH